MGYDGYLLKIGSYEFPNGAIEFKTYKITKYVQDLDPYRDANGVLHRTALKHTAPKIEFSLKPNFTNQKFDDIMNNIKAQYTDAKERKATVKCFVPEDGDYVTESMYMTDPEITIVRQENTNTLIYDRVTFKFISY